MRKTLRTTVAIGLAFLTSAPPPISPPPQFPTDDKAIVHVLNRVGFGPRPGDVAAVREIGLQRYIEQQLQPERIADGAVAARLSGLTTIGMSSREIAEQFEIPQLQMRQERQQQAARSDQQNQPVPPPGATPEIRQRANQVVMELSAAEADPRDLQRAAAPGSADRFLVQPFQRRRAERAAPASC